MYCLFFSCLFLISCIIILASRSSFCVIIGWICSSHIDASCAVPGLRSPSSPDDFSMKLELKFNRWPFWVITSVCDFFCSLKSMAENFGVLQRKSPLWLELPPLGSSCGYRSLSATCFENMFFVSGLLFFYNGIIFKAL